MRRTKEEAAQTRQHILNTSLELFAEKGVSATSLMEIAKCAKLSRGALYWHFKDKWDIFDALWLETAGSVTQLSEATRSEDTKDPLGGFEVLLTHIFQRVVSDPPFRMLVRMILSENGIISDQKVQTRMEQWHEQFQSKRKATLRKAIERGQLKSDFDIDFGARYLHASIDAVLAHWFKHAEYFDLQQRAEQISRAIITAVKSL